MVIPSLFRHNTKTHRITQYVTPGCEWALNSGTCHEMFFGPWSKVIDGNLYKEAVVPLGSYFPKGFILSSDKPQGIYYEGWLPVQIGDTFYFEAWLNFLTLSGKYKPDFRHKSDYVPGVKDNALDGFYVLVGPEVNRNVYRLRLHNLWGLQYGLLDGFNRGKAKPAYPITLQSMDWFFEWNPIYGVLFVNADGRMCRVLRTDFGYPFPDYPWVSTIENPAQNKLDSKR